jgi:PAS domain S-box-containing protein
MLVIVAHALRADDLLRLTEGLDRTAELIRVAESFAEVAQLAADPEGGADAVLIGPLATEPLKVAQRVHSVDRDTSLVILTGQAEALALRQELNFTPFIGPDVEVRGDPITDDLVDNVRAAARRARARRQHKARVAVANTALAEPAPALPQPEQYLDRLLDNAPIGILTVSADGRVVGWNPECSHITGMGQRDAVGKALDSLLASTDGEALAAYLAACIGISGRSAPEVFECRTSHGTRHVRFTGTGVVGRSGEPGALILLEDVTDAVVADRERRRAERDLQELNARLEERVEERSRQLAESTALFRSLFEHSPDGIVLIDPHDRAVPWRIVEANDAYCRMNGYEPQELVGKALDVLHETNAPLDERTAFIAKLRRVGVIKLKGEHRRKDGSLITIDAVTTLVDLAGKELLLGSDRDITERERTQAELARTNTELEARNAEQETFIYTVSHDLRTPLLSIRGMSDLLAEAIREGDLDAAEFTLSRVHKNAERMDDLLNDLLAFSRVGRAAEEASVLDLGHEMDATLSEAEVRLSRRHVQVELPERWPQVCFPSSELRQLLTNLITNAAKWAGSNGERPRVLVAWTSDGERVTIRVSDNGPGIPPEHRDRVFRLFNKLDAKSEGTGVGLAIVRRIVERHGGSTWIEDSPLGGATFAATLPVPG